MRTSPTAFRRRGRHGAESPGRGPKGGRRRGAQIAVCLLLAWSYGAAGLAWARQGNPADAEDPRADVRDDQENRDDARDADANPAAVGDTDEDLADALEASRDHALDFYRPTFFLLAPDGVLEAKFRISIKARLLRRKLGGEGDFLRLFFGYTQTSFWELGQESSPFRETDYNPELFLSWRRDRPRPATGWRFLLVRTGLAHESNGRDGDASRSWNYLFVEPHVVFRRRGAGRDTLQLALRLWPLVDKGEENEDLLDFYGYGQLVAEARLGRLGLRLTGRSGTLGGRAGAALDVTWQTREEGPFHLMAQIWEGYGESLLTYDVSDSRVRLGFMITR